jgi:hypothetical protein
MRVCPIRLGCRTGPDRGLPLQGMSAAIGQCFRYVNDRSREEPDGHRIDQTLHPHRRYTASDGSSPAAVRRSAVSSWLM